MTASAGTLESEKGAENSQDFILPRDTGESGYGDGQEHSQK